jgi:hypothetical protein
LHRITAGARFQADQPDTATDEHGIFPHQVLASAKLNDDYFDPGLLC